MRWLKRRKQHRMPAANSSCWVCASSKVGLYRRSSKLRWKLASRACRFGIAQAVQLVEQHAHLHAAARRIHQFVQQQAAAVVALEDEGLQVDAGARAADQVQARQQRVLAAVEQDHPVLAAASGVDSA